MSAYNVTLFKHTRHSDTNVCTAIEKKQTNDVTLVILPLSELSPLSGLTMSFLAPRIIFPIFQPEVSA